jgi:uncharacterized protein (TIGR02145 family)
MRQKCNLLGLAVIVALSTVAATAVAELYVCGDADGDGTVNVSDAVFLISYVFGGGPPPTPLLVGDCDGNEIVNVSDVVYLIAYIFGGGPEPICPYGTVTDIDGNVYQTLKIGELWWMIENLKVTHYSNGDPIPHVTDSATWSELSTGAYCEYDNDPANVEAYGRLYNWYAIEDSRDIAPEGWHVPKDNEWKQLEVYLGMDQSQADAEGWRGTDEGGKLKESGTIHWSPPNTGATNESGFTALPGGYRAGTGFHNLGHYADFWSTTEKDSDHVWNRGLGYLNSEVSRHSLNKGFGFSLRCVRD